MLTLDSIKEKYNEFIWGPKNTPDVKDLEYLYNDLNLSSTYIGDMFGISNKMVGYYFKKLGIKKKFRFEVPPKELLYDLYIVKNLTVKEVGKIIKKNTETTRDYLQKYGIKKDIQLIVTSRESTCLEKYGVKNPSQADFVKEKKVNSCLKHLGVEYPSQSKEVKSKISDSFITHYGRRSPQQIHISEDSFTILSSKDLLERFIIDNNLDSTKDISSRLGVELVTINRYIKKYGLRYLIKSTSSSYERELKSIFTEFDISNNRTILAPKEIDLYSPEHKIGIEFNGNYWHSDAKKDKYYHQNKSLEAIGKGIFLYHIFEYEWLDERKKLIIISQLKNLLKQNTFYIYARKCIIKEVSSKDSREFLNNNHLQGYCNSKVRLGLYYNDELVSLMTFGKPRFNKKCEWELLRFCNKLNTSVVGGASKLFKHFVDTYKPSNMLSYSNIAKTTGKMYEKLGFENNGVTQPNYVWVKSFTVLSRYQCQVKVLKEQGFDVKVSEDDTMRQRGFFKLYSCGNNIWSIKFKEK